MLATIIRKEFTEMWRDGRVRSAAIALLALLTGALLYGRAQTRALAAERTAAAQAARADWLAQPAKNPHSAAHYGIYAFKPRATLATLDDGVDPYAGMLTWLEAHKRNEFAYRPAQDATGAQRAGALTAATTLQLLVPLLIVVLAAGSFAGEREAGTLRQLLALGVPARTLGAGKALGTAAALGVVLVPAAVLGVLAIVGLGGDVAHDLPRVAVLVGAYLLYFLAWLGVVLAISARAETTRVALAGALGVWMLTTVLAPRVVTELARALHPTPSAATFAAAMRTDLEKGFDGHAGQVEAMRAFERRVLAQYRVDSVSQLPVSFAGLALEEDERVSSVVYDRHHGRLWNGYAAQDRVRAWSALVAPVLAVRALSMGLAGTDVAHHRAFADSAEAYRRRLVGAMNRDMARNAVGVDYEYEATPALWASIGAFDFEAPPLGATLAVHREALGLLGWWGLVGVLLVAGAAARVRP
jgi:ABC-2 type transport system permease protein